VRHGRCRRCRNFTTSPENFQPSIDTPECAGRPGRPSRWASRPLWLMPATPSTPAAAFRISYRTAGSERNTRRITQVRPNRRPNVQDGDMDVVQFATGRKRHAHTRTSSWSKAFWTKYEFREGIRLITNGGVLTMRSLAVGTTAASLRHDALNHVATGALQ
jgi:hypothetical protein